MRIALLGPSSTGKTFLAKKMEELLGVRYLAYETRRYMAELGYGSHPEVLAAGPQACMAFQKGLAYKRDALFRSEPGPFVTDRCTIDNLAYYWVDDAKNDTEADSQDFRKFCLNSFAGSFDVAILFGFGSIPFKTDEARVSNPMYHELTQMVYNRIFEELGVAFSGLCYWMDPAVSSPAARMSEIITIVNASYRQAATGYSGLPFFSSEAYDIVSKHNYGV